MDPGIQMLELAIGIKEVLTDAGFTTIDSLLRTSPSDIATMLGIELYVGKIIIDAAKQAAAVSDTSWQEHDANYESIVALPAD